MSTNANTNEHNIHIMIKSYQDKESKWLHEKKHLRNEITCLKEELKAIRSFILADKAIPTSLDNPSEDHEIVPAFLRACNDSISSDEKPSKKSRGSRVLMSQISHKKGSASHCADNGFSTPNLLDKNKQIGPKYFYPPSMDIVPSFPYQIPENLTRFYQVPKREKSPMIANQKLVINPKSRTMKSSLVKSGKRNTSQSSGKGNKSYRVLDSM